MLVTPCKWTIQVGRTREKWTTSISVLSSAHFADECFEPDAAVVSNIKRLNPGAVPLILKVGSTPKREEHLKKENKLGYRFNLMLNYVVQVVAPHF